MSDDTNDIFANNDDSTQGDKPSDPSLDFGDEFGLVKFADDESAPAISFPDNPADQLPHWTQAPTGEIPKFIEVAEDTISPTPSYGNSRSNVNVTGSSRRIEPNNPPAPVSRDQRESRISIGTDPTDERNRPNSLVASQSDASGNISSRYGPLYSRGPGPVLNLLSNISEYAALCAKKSYIFFT